MSDTLDARVSDAELVAGCRAGDPEAWNALVERFSRYVSAIATQAFRLSEHDAEDVFQNVFLRVYERLGSLRSDDAIRPWVGQLTRNCCLDVIRASGRVVPVEEVEEQVADDAIAKLDEAMTVRDGLVPPRRRVPGDPRPLLRARRELPHDRRGARDPRGNDREQDLALPRPPSHGARSLMEESTPLPRRVDMVSE